MGPTHGIWCGAITWPTKCPSCKKPVFFFRCDCGSKVFFDELGDPWPIHDCETAWTQNLIRVKDKSGGITVQLSEGVSARRPSESFRVEERIISYGRKKKSQSKPDPISAVKPDDRSVLITVVGILREKNNEVNVAKILKRQDLTSMASGFLGPLSEGKWGRATIHEPSSSKNILCSYTIWVPTKLLLTPKNYKGVTVCVDIKPYFIPGHDAVWFCTDYQVLG